METTVDHLMIKSAKKGIDLSLPLSCLTRDPKADPNEPNAYRMEPAKAGDRLEDVIIVFRDGHKAIEDTWYAVQVEQFASTTFIGNHVFFRRIMEARDLTLKGIAIKRYGMMSTVLNDKVWFQDEADAVDFKMRVGHEA